MEYIRYIYMEALSDRYGWLPSEIKKEKIIDIMRYFAILKGKSKSTSQRKIKRII